MGALQTSHYVATVWIRAHVCEMPDVVILPVIKCYVPQVAGLPDAILGRAAAGR